MPPPAAPANEEAQAPGQEVDDGAETADTEEEALGPQLNKLVPIHKRQDLELVQINDNTIPVGNDAVHNNNGMADVLGDITAADASVSLSFNIPMRQAERSTLQSGKTTVPPPAPAPQSDQAGVEDTPADTGTEDTEAAEPLALMNTVQDGSKKSVRKRQDLELAAIDGNSAPVANELVHNNNMAASVAGTIAGLDASSDKTGPPPPAKRALLARAAISMSGNSVPMANDAVHNNNVAGSVMGDITQIDVSCACAYVSL